MALVSLLIVLLALEEGALRQAVADDLDETAERHLGRRNLQVAVRTTRHEREELGQVDRDLGVHDVAGLAKVQLGRQVDAAMPRLLPAGGNDGGHQTHPVPGLVLGDDGATDGGHVPAALPLLEQNVDAGIASSGAHHDVVALDGGDLEITASELGHLRVRNVVVEPAVAEAELTVGPQLDLGALELLLQEVQAAVHRSLKLVVLLGSVELHALQNGVLGERIRQDSAGLGQGERPAETQSNKLEYGLRIVPVKDGHGDHGPPDVALGLGDGHAGDVVLGDQPVDRLHVRELLEEIVLAQNQVERTDARPVRVLRLPVLIIVSTFSVGFPAAGVEQELARGLHLRRGLALVLLAEVEASRGNELPLEALHQTECPAKNVEDDEQSGQGADFRVGKSGDHGFEVVFVADDFSGFCHVSPRFRV